MNRRGFLGALAGFTAALTLDPEKLLWIPGQKLISIPSESIIDRVDIYHSYGDPDYNLISSTTLAELRRDIIYETFFKDPTFQKKLRSHVKNTIDGGLAIGMGYLSAGWNGNP
ncbi:MAG: hypothetical protein ACREJN_12355 [Nitrospiraceae bacterium]